MKIFVIGLCIGLLLGNFIGIVFMGLMVAASNEDRRREYSEPLVIETRTFDFEEIKSQVPISRYMFEKLGEDEAKNLYARKMTNGFGDFLYERFDDFVEVEKMPGYVTDSMLYTGIIRIGRKG